MTALVQLNPQVDKGLLMKQALGLLFLSAVLPAAAAPDDVLLTALPGLTSANAYLEASTDHMNESLDFFKIRDSNALAAGTQAGDYRGAHVSGGWRVRDDLWLSGSLRQRSLNGLSDTYQFSSWQLAGLYRFAQGGGNMPAVAIRLSAWGNYANEVGATNICTAPVANSPTTCQVDAFLNSVKITDPADKALQADLVGTWSLTPTTDFTLMLGAGSTQLSHGPLTGSMTRADGLDYQLSFIGNDVVGTTADGASQFLKKGIYNDSDLAWRGNFIQAGLNTAWRNGPWTLRGGYLFYRIQRQAVDDTLASRGWSSYSQMQNITVDVNYRLSQHMSVFVRGQLNDKLIFNDIPVIYTTFSADLVGGKYSIYSAGLRADF
jgi:hypothetical protein